MRILSLSTSKDNMATRAIQKAGRKRGHSMEILNPSFMSLLVSNIPSGYDRLYYNKKGSVERINIKDFDAIIPRIGQNTYYATFIIDHLSRNLGIFSIQTAEGILNASNKLRTLQLCSEYGLPTPRSVSINTNSNIGGLIEKVGGFPVVLKLTHGSGGKGVALLKDRASTISTIQTLLKGNTNILLQEYIDSGGSDYRAIVVGSRVVACYQRTASSRNEFRANMELGGIGSPVKISKENRILCIKAAGATGLFVAGVDLIKDKSGKSFIVEVNSNFGFRVQNITGVNVAEEIIKYIEQNHNKNLSRKNETKRLVSENLMLRKSLSVFSRNQELNEIYGKVKGKQVVFSDRKGINRRRMVNHPDDLLKIMSETFQIKT